MIDRYEAAELLVVGRAQDVILGVKDFYEIDNRVALPMDWQDTPVGLFEE